MNVNNSLGFLFRVDEFVKFDEFDEKFLKHKVIGWVADVTNTYL